MLVVFINRKTKKKREASITGTIEKIKYADSVVNQRSHNITQRPEVLCAITMEK